jgi:hypothetical protein
MPSLVVVLVVALPKMLDPLVTRPDGIAPEPETVL